MRGFRLPAAVNPYQCTTVQAAHPGMLRHHLNVRSRLAEGWVRNECQGLQAGQGTGKTQPDDLTHHVVFAPRMS